MNFSSEINIAAYSPVREFQIMDIALYKQVIESHTVKFGAKWVIRKITRNNITDQELDGTRATCYFSNSEEVGITMNDVKEAIFQRFQEEYNMRSVRFAMHRAFRSQNEAAVFEKAYKRHDDQKASVKLWLNHLESKNYNHSARLSPEKITIDTCNVEENAIRSIFPSVNIQWCLFHALRAISQQVRTKLVLESLPDNKRAHQAVISQLKGMMWENSRAEYTGNLNQFVQETAIWITTDSLSGEEPINQADIPTWKQITTLKAGVYSDNDIEEDFLSNINRIKMNLGRMEPGEREARRRELETEEVSIHVAMDMISEVEKASLHNAQSFNNEGESYEVRVENGTVKFCSCPEFRYQNRACKYMLLLGRCTEYDVWRGSTYTEVSSTEGLQLEPEHELQREQEDMVQKLKMLKEVVENLRPDEVTSSWKLQVEQLSREVVLRSNQVEELPLSIHLERQR
ncbi:hypothetical protein BCV72DRAFT_332452 [Rhizopus microsporus var. microsporus]|uniref:SWIM-type domain-containing protein n=1 Tax=Rhizopus microsporus var. microsporus TaxID=86635 RepID=A0A1X0RGK0_RHIZD|nr:hypothetical protein BCV72DRAFT_332452 [Rhizopus microsporus var. microsporus]